MGAADKTFEIEIKTTADRTGAQQTQSDLDKLKQNGGASGDILATEKQITAEVKAQGAATTETATASLVNGVNVEKASEAAGRLAKNLALGRDTTQSMGSLMAELAPALAPTAIAALTLYEAMRATNFAAQTLGQLFGGFSIQDLVIGFDPKAILDEVAAAEKLQRLLRDIDKETLGQQESSVEKLGDRIQDLTQKFRAESVAFEGLLEPITNANANLLAIHSAEISSLQAELSLRVLHLENSRLEVALEGRKTDELRLQEEVLRRQLDAQRQGQQLNKEFLAARDATLPAADKLTDFQTRIDAIKSHLQAMGIAANSPNEAFQKSIGLADEARNEIVKLATEWLKLSGNVKSVQGEIEKFEQQRSTARNALITASEAADIAQAAANLAALNKEGKEVLGLKPAGPDAGLEKFLLDTISNSSSSTAQVNQFREALRQLYAQQAAAPKTPAVSPTQNNDPNLPRIVDVRTPVPAPQTPPPTSQLAHGAAQGAGADEAALKIEDGIRTGIDEQTKKIGDIMAAALGNESIFNPIAQAVQSGTAQVSAAVVAAIANLKASFDRETADLQRQIDELWQAQG